MSKSKTRGNSFVSTQQIEGVKHGTKLSDAVNLDQLNRVEALAISGGYGIIEEEGSALPTRTTIDFQGAGVTAADIGGKTVVTIPTPAATYPTIQEEGVSVPVRDTINFVGVGVTVTDSGGTKTLVTITAAAGDPAWELDGNAGTNPVTNFVGTTDAQDLVFRVNNAEEARLTSTHLKLEGDLRINSSTSTEGRIQMFSAALGTFKNIVYSDALLNGFFGINTGNETLTGGSNTVIGLSAGSSLTTGSDNLYIGILTGYYNQTGSNNIAIGRFAQGGPASTAGDYNISLGRESSYLNTAGIRNISLGHFAHYRNTVGECNISLGCFAGRANTTGSNNICIGTHAGDNDTAEQGYQDTVDGKMFIASSLAPITDVYFNGRTVAAVSDIVLNAAGGDTSSNNIVGGDFIIAGGRSTGDAIAGKVKLQTSTAGGAGVAPQSLADRVSVDEFDTDILNNLDINRGLKRSPQNQAIAITLTNISKSLQIVGGAGGFPSYTMDLPIAPEDGLVFTFKANANVAGGNTVTIDGGAIFIDGATTYVLNAAYASLEVVYVLADNKWYII